MTTNFYPETTIRTAVIDNTNPLLIADRINLVEDVDKETDHHYQQMILVRCTVEMPAFNDQPHHQIFLSNSASAAPLQETNVLTVLSTTK